MQWFSSKFLVAALALLALCLFCSDGNAQVAVTGDVLDVTGAAVPGAQVELWSAGRKRVRQAISAAQGEFSLTSVPAGQYSLEVPSMAGFAPYKQRISVAKTAMPPITIHLIVESVQQEVTAEDTSSEVTLDNAENRDQLSASSNMLEKVPVFDQDYIAALTPFLDQGAVGTSGVTIMVDGVEMKSTGVSASAIAEAHINNDPYSAETNRPGRGRIEIITKPGTPHFHGSFTFTFRDSAFDAKNYFAETKPFEQKRIYEGSITGPVGKGGHTTFLISESRQEDNLQAIVLQGLVSANVPQPVHATQAAVRVTHDFSATHRVSLQYNVEDLVRRNVGVGGLVLAESGSNTRSREDDVIFNDRYVLSPTLLNQLQLFFEKDFTPTRSQVAAPKIVVDGAFTSGGAQADLFNTENNGKINDIVSWSHKKHYIKFGINIPNLSRRVYEDHSNTLGTFNFASLADYEAQKPYSFTQQGGPGRTIFWLNEIGTYFQDQLSLRNNLQVSLGLRYDWQTYVRSVHDFAPRASLAYTTADHKTVTRTGAGLFYDRSGALPIADLKRYNGTVIRSITLLNPGYPDPSPTAPPLSTLPTNLVQLDPASHMPYTLHYSVGIEHQLSKKMTVAATYRGSKGFDLFRSRDVNARLPPFYSVRPNPGLGVVRQIESRGRQLQNALDLTLSGKASPWFSGIVQYTLNQTKNDTGGIAWFPANQYDLRGEYGRADFNQLQRLNVLGTINEDHWLNLGIAAKLYSGMPYTETSGVDSFSTGLLNARPDGVNRNTLQTGGTAQLDLRWSRDIAFKKWADHSPAISLAVDGFNVLNRTNYLAYVGNVQSQLFEQPTSAAPARRLQFSTHIKF